MFMAIGSGLVRWEQFSDAHSERLSEVRQAFHEQTALPTLDLNEKRSVQFSGESYLLLRKARPFPVASDDSP
ncbi:MAG: hypothetical protein FWF28_00260 [Micrococcales bacterium]|nr:hypothetical protein [Micrococcales bacterium]